jgi:formamidopyrimidine-DNA glycosylase
MIELPEAFVISQQMNETLKGKHIEYGDRGNTSHKFAFSSGTSEEYTAILAGKSLGKSWSHGMSILTEVGQDHILVLGCGGERILFHPPEAKLPKKTQLFLRFTDQSTLTVTVSGWGNTLLLPAEEAGHHMHVKQDRLTPLNDAFTLDYFKGLFSDIDPESKKSIKYFLVSEPGVWGMGNGCLQDILFYAGLHPRRKVVDIDEEAQNTLYNALMGNLKKIIKLGGRNSEYDLYGNKGGYVRLMDSKTKGTPCPTCSTPIEKISYLGGSCYLCPTCQT